jgi:hypothetical protein
MSKAGFVRRRTGPDEAEEIERLSPPLIEANVVGSDGRPL